MRILKSIVIVAFLFALTAPSVIGQVTVRTESITVEKANSGDGFFLDMFSPNRTYKVNSFGHLLLQNNFSETTTDYWHFGARDNGELDIALGTLSAIEVVDTTNTLMTFQPNGRIGIGTRNPDRKLHISNGEVAGATAGFRVDMIIEDDDAAILQFRGEDFSGISFFDDAVSSYSGVFYEYNADAIQIRTGGVDDRMIISENGDVGIGSDPNAKFHVSNGTGVSSGVYNTAIDAIIEDDDRAYLEFNGGPISGITFNDESASLYAGVLYNSTEDYLTFRTANTANRMIIAADGKIGIADTAPSAKLHVKQEQSGEEAFAMENNGNGDDIWSFEIGANDLNLYYDADGDGLNAEILHGKFDEATLGSYISSDSKLKHNVKPLNSDVLSEINQLRPVSYFYNHDQEKTKRAFGFIAQEVQKVLPELILQPEEDTENPHLMLNYDDFTPFAIKGIQELDKKTSSNESEILTLKTENEELKKELAALKAQVAQLLEVGGIKTRSLAGTVQKTSFMEQNVPNPFNESTTINYFIAAEVEQASLHITNAQGQLVKSIEITTKGHDTVSVNAKQFKQGVYFYTLVLDGKPASTKQMLFSN